MSKLIKVISFLLMSTCLMGTAGLGIYSVSAKPSYYAQFMSLGNKYLLDGQYTEAIIEFSKAIKIERKSTDARLGAGKGHVGNNDIDKAVVILKEAQQIDIKNEKLLKQITDILWDVDPEAAFEILRIYINAVGENHISKDIREMLDSVKEPPAVPAFYPVPDIYWGPVTVQMTFDKVRIGHTCYYTTDGSEPDKTSAKYRGGIRIDSNCEIKAVSYNPNGEVTEIASAAYQFDYEIKDKLSALIDEAMNKYEAAEVGTAVGNCIQGAKEEFLPFIESAQALLKQEFAAAGYAYDGYQQLSDAVEGFLNKIIPACDKTELNKAIEKAVKLYSEATEGNSDGQIRSGSKKTLNGVIERAKALADNILAKQSEADAMATELNNAMVSFENSRVKVIVNPDGSNFTYGFKSLIGDSTNKTFTGRFTVTATGTAQLAYGNTKYMTAGESGTITITFTRTDNTVTVSSTETWSNNGSSVYTIGTWYAEYNGATNHFLLYPSSGKNSDRFEGTYTDGTMKGKMYLKGIGYCIEFTAE